MRWVIFSIPFMILYYHLSDVVSASQGVHQQQDGGQQRQNSIELHDTAQDDALGGLVGTLGDDVDGSGSHAALENGGQPAAQRDGQAGDENGQALGNSYEIPSLKYFKTDG